MEAQSPPGLGSGLLRGAHKPEAALAVRRCRGGGGGAGPGAAPAAAAGASAPRGSESGRAGVQAGAVSLEARSAPAQKQIRFPVSDPSAGVGINNPSVALKEKKSISIR